MRSSNVISVSLPPQLQKEAERIAAKEGRTRSELFREALRRYIWSQKWAELQRATPDRLKERVLKEDEIERSIEESRKSRQAKSTRRRGRAQ